MTLVSRKLLVSRFLGHCNVYADDKLAGYRAQLDTATRTDVLALQDKIGHWTAYRTFNEHAISELETTALDAWLEDSPE